MSLITLANDRPSAGSPLIIERFLRDDASVWRQIQLEEGLNGLIRQMLASSAVALACYGAVMGIAHSPWQALASAAKLPLLYLLTLAVCLPTLYLFNLLCGGQLSARQSLALVLAAITVTSALTLAFAPITLFFLITAWNYHFFILLNVAILTLTGGVGLSFLVGGVRTMNKATPPPAPAPGAEPAPAVGRQQRSANMGLLYLWLLLYGFVGTQLGWTLRPFFCDPGMPFVLFRPIESNFYVGLAATLAQIVR